MSTRSANCRALAIAGMVGLAGCTDHLPDRGGAPPSASATGACRSEVRTGEPPSWARSGFGPGASVPYVVGDRGDIVAVLLGDPLHAPPLPGRASKILWVAREGTGPAPSGQTTKLEIEARLDRSDRGNSELVVSREVADGPGPSIVDLPQAGCWNLSLSWSGHTDTLAIVYQAE